jgi:sugar phosphate isomerase/epimerase
MMDRSIPIAVSTGSLYPLSTVESIQRLKELGIQTIELTLQPDEFFITFERTLSMTILPELLASVQSGDFRVGSVHAPMMRAERCYNLWSRLNYLMHSIEVCRLLGGQVVVIHPFHLFRTHEQALGYLANDGVSLPSSLLPGIIDIMDQANSANIILALENIQDWHDEPFFNAPKNMLRFLREMDHPSLSFTLDLMHAQVSGTLDGFTSSLANQVVNIHASDLLPPIKRVAVGKGVIDWERLVPKLQALPYLRQITVELSNPQEDEIIESVRFFDTVVS